MHIYMLNESQQKPKPRKQHSTHKKKDRMRTSEVQIEIKKGKEEKKKDKSTPATQERTQHARGIRILQARKERGGGCSAEAK